MKKSAKIVGLSLAAALLGGQALNNQTSTISYDTQNYKEKQEEPELSLKDFPTQIPGAREVKKYEVPGAKNCIIHIRQAHLPMGKIIAEAQNPEKDRVMQLVNQQLFLYVNSVQRDIYSILNSLNSELGLDNVLEEGIPNGLEIDAHSLGAARLRIIDTAKKAGYISPALEYEEFRYAPGALVLLGAEEKMRLVPSEDPNLISLRPPKAKLELIRLLDKRENYFLKMANREEGPIKAIVLGGGHAFGGRESCGPSYSLEGRLSMEDNVATWNAAHPDNKFSLIEITPESYKESGF